MARTNIESNLSLLPQGCSKHNQEAKKELRQDEWIEFQ